MYMYVHTYIFRCVYIYISKKYMHKQINALTYTGLALK